MAAIKATSSTDRDGEVDRGRWVPKRASVGGGWHPRTEEMQGGTRFVLCSGNLLRLPKLHGLERVVFVDAAALLYLCVTVPLARVVDRNLIHHALRQRDVLKTEAGNRADIGPVLELESGCVVMATLTLPKPSHSGSAGALFSITGVSRPHGRRRRAELGAALSAPAHSRDSQPAPMAVDRRQLDQFAMDSARRSSPAGERLGLVDELVAIRLLVRGRPL
jgi:hypothetical protein